MVPIENFPFLCFPFQQSSSKYLLLTLSSFSPFTFHSLVSSIWHDDHHRFSFRLLVLLLPSHHHFFFLWFSLVESLSLSNSLQPCRLHHPRLPCTSSAPGACSNMSIKSVMPPTISSSVVHFSSHLQSCSALGSFPVSQLFASGGQRIGVSALALVLPMNVQDWSPLGWIDWISLQVQGTLKSLLQHHSSKASILRRSAVFTVQLSHPYMTTGKTIALSRQTLVGKAMSLLFNMHLDWSYQKANTALSSSRLKFLYGVC